MQLPIRIRLTLWYSGVLLLVLVAFAAAMYFSFRRSLEASIDSELSDRLHGVTQFLNTAVIRHPRAKLWHEFEEGVELRPGEMLQVADTSGWVFQSPSIRGLELGEAVHRDARFQTATFHGMPFRVCTATLWANGERFRVQLAAGLGPPYQALTGFLDALMGFIPVLLVVASGGGYWLSGRALNPVNRIIEDARTIGHYSLSRRLIVPQTRDELQRLSETLNEMIGRLQAAFQRTTRFTADASHELRSPLAFILATAEVALLQPRTAGEYKTAVTGIHGEARRMTELIENLLALARADSGSAQLKMVSLDVCKPLEQACLQAIPQAHEKGIAFVTDLPGAALRVIGDAIALRRLWWILIDNAIKYTPEGGSVDVSLGVSGASAVVIVKDTGIGITSEEQNRIFERFYRSDKARQRDSGGTGLGLAIAGWIAEVHHSRIEVLSEPGRGSSFTVRLIREA
jgi:heavy metal sensor kinase